jgi:mono/diheme cytochrome c family protein
MLPARPPIVLAQATLKPVTYSNDQAKRGEVQFKETCVDCHGDDLRGGLNGGPPLRGIMFNMDFGNGAPASSLFLFMSTQMPPEAPGRFSDATYAELMAYVLQVNGYEAGAPLPSNSAALDNLALTK